MSLKQMSYNTAGKIFNLYSDQLIGLDAMQDFKKYYRLSDMRGFDFIDVSNSLKLISAFNLFNKSSLDEKSVAELKQYAIEDSSALISFFKFFLPDEIVNQLESINVEDEQSIIKYGSLKNEYFLSELKRYDNVETPESFLGYCIRIGKDDPNYWGKVYNRLGINWEKNNVNDPIYVLIKNGINFLETTDNEKIVSDQKKKNQASKERILSKNSISILNHSQNSDKKKKAIISSDNQNKMSEFNPQLVIVFWIIFIGFIIFILGLLFNYYL